MKPDFKAHWVARDEQFVINYKKTSGKWTTKCVGRDIAPTEADRQAAERWAAGWYENYARNGGRVLGFSAPPEPEKTTQTEYPPWLDYRKASPKIKVSTWMQN